MKKLLCLILILMSVTLIGCKPKENTDNGNLEVELVSIDEVNIRLNLGEYITTSTSQFYDVYLLKTELGNDMSIEAKSGYRFSEEVSLIVNDTLVDKESFTLLDGKLIYSFNDSDITQTEEYVTIDVTFDTDGGYWSSSIFESFNTNEEVIVSTLNDTSGDTITLVDDSVTTLKWFYKLFVTYDDTYEAYRIVYIDEARTSISDLNLDDYDYVIAVHDSCLDVVGLNKILDFIDDFEENSFVLFDLDLLTYTSGNLITSFYSPSDISQVYNKVMNEEVVLPIPYKPEFVFTGWSDGTSIYTSFPRYIARDNVDNITYTAIYESKAIEEVNMYLSTVIPTKLTNDLSLPSTYSGYSLSWSSSNSDLLTDDGIYNRPYEETSVDLTVTISKGEEIVTKVFTIEVTAYKSLSAPLTSSYIYRDYRLVDNSFFESLDIINCAFIHADSNGVLTGTSVLNSIETYIMPKAKENGNWVVFSVAPSSDWSDIASSPTAVNAFADNIVSMINDYGFDGVDIDWETPTSSEATSFTELMRVVYTKVKANNPNHLVTAAIAGGMWQPARYDLVNSHQYLDYINMMTYGMVSNNGQYQNALSSSNMFDNVTNSVGKTLVSCSIEESVAIYNNYGIPNSKIIVGAAFYGMKQTRTYNSSTSTWSSWTSAGSVHYTDIYNNYESNSNYDVYYDTTAGVPYILKTDGTEFISYDNSRSILEKSAYIIEEGLAGMMYWEHGLDQTGLLLLAMDEGLN